MRVGSFYPRHRLTPLAAAVALAVVLSRGAGRRRQQRAPADDGRDPDAAGAERPAAAVDRHARRRVEDGQHQARRAGGDEPQDHRRLAAADRGRCPASCAWCARRSTTRTCGSARWRRKSTRCATRSRRGRHRRRGRSERAAAARPRARPHRSAHPGRLHAAAGRRGRPAGQPRRRHVARAAVGHGLLRLRRRSVAAGDPGLRDLHPRLPANRSRPTTRSSTSARPISSTARCARRWPPTSGSRPIIRRATGRRTRTTSAASSTTR